MLENPSRRSFLKATVTAPAVLAVPGMLAAEEETVILTARRQIVPLVGQGYPETEIWGYDGRVPGPIIRITRGGTVRVQVRNELDQPTTVHWHGLRIDNKMDGVPGLTQTAIAPGEDFAYRITPPDAGTFWYHSHVNSSEQIGRGLHGALIVDEIDPPRVDRDLVWILDDWLLNRDAQIVNSFDHPRDASHGGQIGNTVTVNGRILRDFAVRTNERLRLRLINAANGRIFRLKFVEHAPLIIALDGQPVPVHEPEDSSIVLAPAMRADLLLDCTGAPGQRFSIVDSAYRQPYELLQLVYQTREPVRSKPAIALPRLPSNDLHQPDLTQAVHLNVSFGGGMHGQLAGARYRGQWLDVRRLFQQGKMWAINGVVGESEGIVPLYTLRLGRTYVLHLTNKSAWPHPVHLHGHHFRLLSRNGDPVAYRPWLDTVLLEPRDKVDVAFVADNPGHWMFHCHIPEHMATGMATVFRVV